MLLGSELDENWEEFSVLFEYSTDGKNLNVLYVLKCRISNKIHISAKSLF